MQYGLCNQVGRLAIRTVQFSSLRPRQEWLVEASGEETVQWPDESCWEKNSKEYSEWDIRAGS